ncbi:MAG TPA: hypothetical protein VHX86_02395 [Tepidisphaeraceae bacterium]|jgi:hypothetical protein|nr:hypothetical protein [Tepidisphaeraceae bacterium]
MLQSSASSRPRTTRRWLRVLLGAAALIVLIIVAAQIVFFTDLPRSFVVNAVQKQLGLRLSAKSLSTGFFGHTTLNDVTLTLPLSDKAFLTVPVLKLKHTWLPLLLVGKSLNIDEISVDHARLNVVQDPRGSWNLEEVAQLLARAGGGNNANQQTQENEIPLLPELHVTDATLIVTDNQHRSTTIDHLNVTGTPNGPLVWEYHATVPDHLDLTGKVAPGGVWAHQVNLALHNVGDWASPWVASWPASAQLQAKWTGQINSGNLAGRLDLEKAEYASLSLTGPLELTSAGDQAAIRPDGLFISNSAAHATDARLVGGQITINGAGVQSQNLGLEFAGGRASLDGKYTFADGSASVHAAWRDVALPSSVVQSGDLQLQYAADLGSPRFQATLQSNGSLKSGQWNATIALDGAGNTLKTLSLSLVAQKFRFETSDHQSIDLSGLRADIGSYPDGLLLRNLSVGNAHPLAGRGGYSIVKHTAWLSLDGRGWAIPGAASNTFDADLDIWTNPDRIHLEQLYLRTGLLSAYVNGDYVFNLPKPVKAHVYLSENQPIASLAGTPQPFRGSLQSNIDLNGTIAPLDLALTGAASGNDVHFGQRPFGNVKLTLAGYFRNGQISLGTHDVQLLGGAWTIDGEWPVHNSLFRIDNLSVKHLSLPLAADTDKIAGTLDGKWTIDVQQLSPDGIVIDGSAAIHNLVIGNPRKSAAAQYLNFNQIQISSTQLDNGIVEIQPIILTRKVGSATGQASASLSTTLEHPTLLSIDLDAKSWPALAQDSPVDCLIGAKGHFDLDLADASALGHLDLSADASWKSHPIAQLQTTIEADRRQFQARNIQIKSLGGSAIGDANVDIDHLYQTRIGLYWKDINLADLNAFSPDLASTSGKIAGSLEIQPATTPRPLEPLAINLHAISRGARIGAIKIGDLRLSAYLGSRRLVLDDSPSHPSDLAIAGGSIHFWGRISKHKGDIYQSLLQMNLNHLDLDAVMPAGAKTNRTPGILGGQITIVGNPRQPNFAFGQGRLTIEKSDLAGTGPIAVLYNLMHILHNANKPTGEGEIDFTIQNKNADISAMRYYDKGSEIRIIGQIADLLHLPHSRINLIGVGSARPLSSIDIPGVSDIDKALGAIQHDAVSVKITGFLDKPKTTPILFGDLTRDMKNLLFGDATAEKN